MDEVSRPPPPQIVIQAPSLLPGMIKDMRGIKATECMAIPPKSDRTRAPETFVTHSHMAASILTSRMHHQHDVNGPPGTSEVQWTGGEGDCGRGTSGKGGRGILRGGDRPPAVFVQRHSEKTFKIIASAKI